MYIKETGQFENIDYPLDSWLSHADNIELLLNQEEELLNKFLREVNLIIGGISND